MDIRASFMDLKSKTKKEEGENKDFHGSDSNSQGSPPENLHQIMLIWCGFCNIFFTAED